MSAPPQPINATATSDGRCAHCGKPKATARDYLRRRNRLDTSSVCWAEARGPDAWLRPEEETADAETLRALLAAARRAGHVLLCDAEAPIGKRRDWKSPC